MDSVAQLLAQYSGSIEELIVVVIGSIMAAVIYGMYEEHRKKPKIAIQVARVGNNMVEDYKGGNNEIGFSISLLKGAIIDASPICNDIEYRWHYCDTEGKEIEVPARSLYSGGSPSLFFPFSVETHYEAVSDKNRLDIVVRDGH